MIKQILKRFWPILTVVLLLCFGAGIIAVRSFLPGPEKAVKGYLEASLRYDVDDMLFYASEYQKKALAGNADIPEEKLRANLKMFYDSQHLQPEKGTVLFSDVSVTDIDPETERYRSYLKEYGYKADAGTVRGFALVKLTCTIENRRRTLYRVVAVKSGARWYYGFIEPM